MCRNPSGSSRDQLQSATAPHLQKRFLFKDRVFVENRENNQNSVTRYLRKYVFP
jgi:hypothetical protein